jgi:plasmid rolling circle replication initiator protein Rep
MNMKRSQEENILRDLDNKGKVRDWRGKKMSSLGLSNIYRDIAEKVKPEYEKRGVHKRYKKVVRKIKDAVGNITGTIVNNESMGLYDKNGERVVNYEKRSGNMRFCGSFLEFADTQDRLKLVKANFCRVPLCPMCQWRKSMRIFFEVSKIMRVIEERYIDYIPVFLTLTVKNCSLESLSKTLDDIFDGWFEFMRSGQLNPMIKGETTHIIKGWFRALEVEYNDKRSEFHPHFHAIMLVEKNYFKGKNYKRTEEWVQLWRKAAKLDYDPICDIRRTRTSKGKREEVAEVAKYTYKDAEILRKKLSANKKADVIKYLSGALHGRRLYAYGGVMKEVAAELKMKDIDKADLIKVDDENINPSLVKMILRYNWNVGVSNYTLSKKIKSVKENDN